MIFDSVCSSFTYISDVLLGGFVWVQKPNLF